MMPIFTVGVSLGLINSTKPLTQPGEAVSDAQSLNRGSTTSGEEPGMTLAEANSSACLTFLGRDVILEIGPLTAGSSSLRLRKRSWAYSGPTLKGETSSPIFTSNWSTCPEPNLQSPSFSPSSTAAQ